MLNVSYIRPQGGNTVQMQVEQFVLGEVIKALIESKCIIIEIS